MFLRNERQWIVTAAFEELYEKKQNIVGMTMEFCHNCFSSMKPITNDEIADISQFTTENGIHRCYKGALKKEKDMLIGKTILWKCGLNLA